MCAQKVVIITTGGTIAMRYDPVQKGLCPAATGPELIEAVPELAGVAPVEVVEFSNIPSPHMSPRLAFELAHRVDEIAQREDVAGIVITHGTDTLEETAYMLDLIVKTDKPVCLTAAMRSSAESSPDGPKNILCAVKAAACPKAVEAGVLVVMNEEIHTALEVTKTHSANVKTFASPFWGPIGYVDADRVIIRRKSQVIQKIQPDDIVDDVYLIKVVAGMDDFFFRCLVEKQVKGIVVEGLGRGNVNPAVKDGIKLAREHQIPVVLATRVHAGRVLDTYGYDGGVRSLKDYGIIMAGEITGQKARIKLMAALGITNDIEKLAKYFDN
ncbi:putative L-asparaginase [bioreactor metagenome]|uniref:Putative L-asparaginase n=1 Tax=bioreactor metagenome TaxID=1076179 RepID=A0A644TNJ6_9ZZZZ